MSTLFAAPRLSSATMLFAMLAGVLFATACQVDSGPGSGSWGFEWNDTPSACTGLTLDFLILNRESGEAQDLFGTFGNLSKADAYGRIWLSGAVSATERLALRKNTDRFSAPFFRGEAIPVTGTTIRIRVMDKDWRNHDKLADFTVPLSTILGDVYLRSPNGGIAVRGRCGA